MATLSHERPVSAHRFPALEHPEIWASLAIVVVWLAVLFDAVFGANITTTSGGSLGTVSTVPSAIPVAFFAFLATIPIARYGFKHDR